MILYCCSKVAHPGSKFWGVCQPEDSYSSKRAENRKERLKSRSWISIKTNSLTKGGIGTLTHVVPCSGLRIYKAPPSAASSETWAISKELVIGVVQLMQCSCGIWGQVHRCKRRSWIWELLGISILWQSHLRITIGLVLRACSDFDSTVGGAPFPHPIPQGRWGPRVDFGRGLSSRPWATRQLRHTHPQRVKKSPQRDSLQRWALGSSEARRPSFAALQVNLADDCHHSAMDCLSAAWEAVTPTLNLLRAYNNNAAVNSCYHKKSRP